MSEAAARFEATDSGGFRVTGNLSFETVPDLWKRSLDALSEVGEAVIDLGQVSHVDSAGLALVIEWIRWARRQKRRLSLAAIPEKLVALARISETDRFLEPDPLSG